MSRSGYPLVGIEFFIDSSIRPFAALGRICVYLAAIRTLPEGNPTNILFVLLGFIWAFNLPAFWYSYLDWRLKEMRRKGGKV